MSVESKEASAFVRQGRDVWVPWYVVLAVVCVLVGAGFVGGRLTGGSGGGEPLGVAWRACLDNSGAYIGRTQEDTFSLMGQCMDDYLAMRASGGSARVSEDSAGWDCRTMGNRRCGR